MNERDYMIEVFNPLRMRMAVETVQYIRAFTVVLRSRSTPAIQR